MSPISTKLLGIQIIFNDVLRTMKWLPKLFMVVLFSSIFLFFPFWQTAAIMLPFYMFIFNTNQKRLPKSILEMIYNIPIEKHNYKRVNRAFKMIKMGADFEHTDIQTIHQEYLALVQTENQLMTVLFEEIKKNPQFGNIKFFIKKDSMNKWNLEGEKYTDNDNNDMTIEIKEDTDIQVIFAHLDKDNLKEILSEYDKINSRIVEQENQLKALYKTKQELEKKEDHA